MKQEIEVETGFGRIPIPTYVFIAEADDADTNTKVPWYVMDYTDKDNPKVQGIFEPGFTGVLQGIKVTEKEWKNKPVFKFDFVFKAGKESFVFRLGVGSHCARSMILAFHQYIDKYQTLKNRFLTFQVQNADEENVIFFNLFDTESGDRFKIEFDKKCKLQPLMENINEDLDYIQPSKDSQGASNQASEEENVIQGDSELSTEVSDKRIKKVSSVSATDEPDDDEKAEIINSADELLDGEDENDSDESA